VSRGLFAIVVVLVAVEVAVLAAVLPERVPLHFGADLAADRYGSRAEFLWVAGGVAAGLTALFAGCAALVQRVALEHLNVPHPGYWKTPEREPELRRRMAEDLVHVGTATLLLLAGVYAVVGGAAVTGADEVSPWVLALVAAYTAGVLAWVAWLLLRRYRPPSG
jgi:Protein of unknown function (DUF1648)